jgi:hypothetical protein
VSALAPAKATQGNKPKPLQTPGSTVQIVREAMGENPIESGFLELGPDINGYGRVVPPLHSIQTMVNTIESR